MPYFTVSPKKGLRALFNTRTLIAVVLFVAVGAVLISTLRAPEPVRTGSVGGGTQQYEPQVSSGEVHIIQDTELVAGIQYMSDMPEAQQEEFTEVEPSVPSYIRMDKPAIEQTAAKPLKNATVSSLFGYRLNPVTGKYKFHSGYDLAAPSGTEIYAMYSGTVSFAGYDSGYGYYIIIDHDGGLQTLYAHCSKLIAQKGDEVQKGEKIALVGSTGNSTGAHLHIEIRCDGQRYDPEWILGGIYG